ncbi:hypothetical protein [Streptomyces sp. NPDC001530]|uniref:hypothetical protein n=1 Tax=Streptomyces sp. NPDC001530 TaxID=3364582 RepID=UPI00368FBC33
MPDGALQMTLLLGATTPTPAPVRFVDALISAEVQSSYIGADAFQVTFALAKDSLIDYSLLRDELLMPPNRLCLVVRFGVRPEVLVDGMITHHQVQPSNRPGDTVLVVSGDDISTRLALADRTTSYPERTDSDIVTEVLRRYLTLGLRTDIERTTSKPGKNDPHRVQTGTDLEFIRGLARANGFVFSIDPTATPGTSTAYWGPEDRRTRQDPQLTMNMGAATNVDRPITFSFNAMRPVKPVLSAVRSPESSAPVQAPDLPGPRLVRRPTEPLRTVGLYDTGGLTLEEAKLRALEARVESADAVTAIGQLDTARYGTLLRAGRRVTVRGVGASYNGDYLIRRVTSELRRGTATQHFVLGREGLGALGGGGSR